MKSFSTTVVWLGFVAAVATLALLAPRTGWLPSRAGDATPRPPRPAATARAGPIAASVCRTALSGSEPVVGPRTARDELAAMADEPQVVFAETPVAKLFEEDPSLESNLRDLLAAAETESRRFSDLSAAGSAADGSGMESTIEAEGSAVTVDADLVAELSEAAAVAETDTAGLIPAPPAPPQPPSPWPRPAGLVSQLETLATRDDTGAWAKSVAEEIDRLHTMAFLDATEAGGSLERLATLAKRGKEQAEQLDSPAGRVGMLRAGYALTRRLVIWQPIHAAAAAVEIGVPADQLDRAELAGALATVEEVLRESDFYDGWGRFLLLEEFRAAATADDPALTEARRLARRLLARFESPRLEPAQQEFLKRDLFDSLLTHLRRWAAEPVDYTQLLATLELFEDSPTSVVANRLADEWNRLRWAPQEEGGELARRLNTYYRNANVRFAVSNTLLNRLVPIVQDMNEDVDDVVAGTRAVGRSSTSTQLVVRLIPDRNRWRVRVEAEGQVRSRTASNVGAVRLFNRGEASFRARQLLAVGQQGIQVDEPEVGADADTRLIGIETEFDVWPLLGPLVQRIARNQHEAKRDEASREVEYKVAIQARRRLGEEVEAAVAKAEREFHDQVLSPLQTLDLNPQATEMMTTKQRLIMRCRLASSQQMAANTPRPRAPSDSLLSVQVHESAANNLVEQFHLAGETRELHDLYRELSGKFEQGEVEVPEDIPEGVTVRFADEEPVRVWFTEGRVAVWIRIAELDGGRRTWRNFEIRGYYRPESTTSNADLVRDGTIELIGEKLGFRDKIALRGIFSKVLSKKRKLPLIAERLVNDPRLEDVRVTQFMVENGWIGVALASRPGRPDLVARPAEADAHSR